MAKKSKTQDKGYAEKIEHVEATRPEPWPGIPGRSEEHESEPEREAEAGESGGRRSDSTEAQRQL
ncbi:MAG TPA: hypothetical protein VFO83_10735, partial [Aggregicoccus sp.]|nr:hypothetical protein [Aggregicoccus sp.]